MGTFDPWAILDWIIGGLGVIVFRPFDYPTLFWPIVFLVVMQYRRMAQTKADLFALAPESIWRPAATAVGYGLLGGVIGSLLTLLFGITISESGFVYLWPIALVLMLINVRYMCFAYAGGLLSLAALIMGWNDISVPQIMGMVAILHMVEAFLIYVSGHQSNLPVYLRHRRGDTVGAYNLQSFWPIPLLLLMLIPMADVPEAARAGMQMPDWWPLIAPSLPAGMTEEQLMFAPLPIVAGLGYGDLALTRSPLAQSRRSALALAAYSLVLLLLAVLASHVPATAFLAALFSPLGHEALILWSQKREMEGAPLFVPSPLGVRVLGVSNNSPASLMGLQIGDVICRVNGMDVRTGRDLAVALSWSPSRVEVEYVPWTESGESVESPELSGSVGPGEAPDLRGSLGPVGPMGPVGALMGFGGAVKLPRGWKRGRINKDWHEPFGVIAVPGPDDDPLVTINGDNPIWEKLMSLWRREAK
ncbi:PDZ domain-containing protein [Heliophilum fasciatum]|uniref:PDZ domain-containing protein n=1 Tax=Heliophilum fasciatum TaxID=35700 RepID=A0A4V2SW77_9FIRM|nr:PDZ domain-containing protein [Heliophilum fasciatum]MCW2279219.1 hypothetical protein [Heliophilum fasciatum]TCP60806.1 hypothetical protein EDD73_1339 [Heliophilum fasciatum]